MRINLPRPFYTVGWAVIVGAAAVLEVLALVDRDNGETLTAHVRDLFWREDGTVQRWFAPLHVAAVAWYAWHIHTEQRGRGAG